GVMYTSFAQLSADLAAGALAPEVHWVLYDLEDWAASPENEKRQPALAMESFANLAHAHGLQVITIPYPSLADELGVLTGATMYEAYLRDDLAGAAARYADITANQAQQIELDPGTYEQFVVAT